MLPLKKILLIAVILVSAGLIWGANYLRAETAVTDDRICAPEAGKGYYPGKYKCCGNMVSLVGNQMQDGRCNCTEEQQKTIGPCAGALICAPCGNDKCEKEYGEDPCNCPKDCPK